MDPNELILGRSNFCFCEFGHRVSGLLQAHVFFVHEGVNVQLDICDWPMSVRDHCALSKGQAPTTQMTRNHIPEERRFQL
jgi:hypothetical protein